jgi:hypothetical protein
LCFAFLAYFGGQMSSYWEHLQGHANGEHGAALATPIQGMINMVHFMLPRLDKFDVKRAWCRMCRSASITCGWR